MNNLLIEDLINVTVHSIKNIDKLRNKMIKLLAKFSFTTSLKNINYKATYLNIDF